MTGLIAIGTLFLIVWAGWMWQCALNEGRDSVYAKSDDPYEILIVPDNSFGLGN